MLIKFLHSIAGQDFKFGKGTIEDVPDEMAIEFVNTGNAVVVGETPKGLQQPVRVPEIIIPQVHTTVIKAKDVAKRSHNKKK